MDRKSEYDVVIVGGGPGGCAAAVGAAQAGAKTLLVERSPYLGGEATHVGIGAFCGFFSCGKNPVRVVQGAGQMVLDEMAALGPVCDEIVSAVGNRNYNFHQEYLKCALDNLLEKAGAESLLHAQAVSAETEGGSVLGVTCADDDGLFTVKAKAFIDATGDANLAHLCGAQTTWGDDEGKVQLATLAFRLCGVDQTCDFTPNAVAAALAKAKEAGFTGMTREKGFILKRVSSSIVAVLLPSAVPNGLTAHDLTEMERDTRKQVLVYVKALKQFLPGMENAELAVMGPSIGLRETRKIVGRETITAEDVITRRKRPDGVARGGWKPEIHKDLQKMGTYLEVADGWFDVPLGALISKDFGNLFGCGRLVSADDIGTASVRVMGSCFATGHAAGVAAALLALKGETDAQAVRAELVRQGALV